MSCAQLQAQSARGYKDAKTPSTAAEEDTENKAQE